MLLPSSESKLLARWQGPFEVIRRMELVNNEIHQPQKQKEIQIYDADLIKAWKYQED